MKDDPVSLKSRFKINLSVREGRKYAQRPTRPLPAIVASLARAIRLHSPLWRRIPPAKQRIKAISGWQTYWWLVRQTDTQEDHRISAKLEPPSRIFIEVPGLDEIGHHLRDIAELIYDAPDLTQLMFMELCDRRLFALNWKDKLLGFYPPISERFLRDFEEAAKQVVPEHDAQIRKESPGPGVSTTNYSQPSDGALLTPPTKPNRPQRLTAVSAYALAFREANEGTTWKQVRKECEDAFGKPCSTSVDGFERTTKRTLVKIQSSNLLTRTIAIYAFVWGLQASNSKHPVSALRKLSHDKFGEAACPSEEIAFEREAKEWQAVMSDWKNCDSWK